MFGVQTLKIQIMQVMDKIVIKGLQHGVRHTIEHWSLGRFGKAQPNVYFHKMIELPVVESWTVESSISIYPDFKKNILKRELQVNILRLKW